MDAALVAALSAKASANMSEMFLKPGRQRVRDFPVRPDLHFPTAAIDNIPART